MSKLRLAGLDGSVSDFSTISLRHKHLKMRISIQKKQRYLHLLEDHTGIKMMGEGEREVKKHSGNYCRQWRKLHLAIDGIAAF